MHKDRTRLLLLFALQVLLCVHGNFIFVNRVNPFALLAISLYLPYLAAQMLRQVPQGTQRSVQVRPILLGLLGAAIVLLCLPFLQGIWHLYADPSISSDVLPQLKGQADLFFSGETPYQRIRTLAHAPYPVYLPLQWLPFQLANVFHTDIRLPGIIFLAIGVGVAAYSLGKWHPAATWRTALLSVLLLALPVWAYMRFAIHDLGISAEGIVALYYLLVATGLAVRNKWLIALGIIGAVLSRYSLLFWLPLLAVLLWFYGERRYSWALWGSVALAVLGVFVVPFLLKDPSILTNMAAHYGSCVEASWVRPDQYTFLEGLSLNIHLREWLPGKPAQSLPYAHWPQFAVQISCAVFAIVFYRREGHKYYDIFTYALLWLAVMPMLLYIFSPMLFRYYMLVPLSISAVLVGRVLAMDSSATVVK